MAQNCVSSFFVLTQDRVFPAHQYGKNDLHSRCISPIAVHYRARTLGELGAVASVAQKLPTHYRCNRCKTKNSSSPLLRLSEMLRTEGRQLSTHSGHSGYSIKKAAHHRPDIRMQPH